MLYSVPTLTEELDVLELIDDSRAQLRAHMRVPRRWSGSLRRVTQARSVQGSNSIEGYHASLDDVIAAGEGEEPLDASTETREAVRGYRDAMTYVLQLSRTAQPSRIDVSLLTSLQFMMLRHDLTKNPGQLRPGAIWITREADGEVVYQAPDRDIVEALLDELVATLAVPGDHQVVDAAMAHLNLVLIHPFSDGNGRMARCLQTLVLARSVQLVPEFASIEEYLGRNTAAYYDVLAEVGGGGWHPDRDTRPWLRFCLVAHYRQLQTLLRRVDEAETTWAELEGIVERHGLPTRAVAPLYDATLGFRLRNPSYRSAVESAEGTEIADQTASRDLRALVEAKVLVAHGERRGRFYTAGVELEALRARLRASRSRQLADPFDIVAERRQGTLFPTAPE